MGDLHLLLEYHIFLREILQIESIVLLYCKGVWRQFEKCLLKSSKNQFILLFAVNQMFQCFVITLRKWMKFENRLTFAYYSVTFWNFKSLQSVSETWQMLKKKRFFYKNLPNIEVLFFYDYQSWFLVIFSNNYQHRLLFKILFLDHIFPKVLKYCTENLYFPSTSKYTSPPSPFFFWLSWKGPATFATQ